MIMIKCIVNIVIKFYKYYDSLTSLIFVLFIV